MQAVGMHVTFKSRGQQLDGINYYVSCWYASHLQKQRPATEWNQLSCKLLKCVPPSKAEAGSWVEGTAWSGWGESRPDSLVRPVSLSLVG